MENKGITFTECYKNPQVLLAALRHLPDGIHVSVVTAIKNELNKFEDEPGIVKFVKIIST